MPGGRPKSKGGLRIDVDDATLADPAISAAVVALVRLLAPRATSAAARTPDPAEGDGPDESA